MTFNTAGAGRASLAADTWGTDYDVGSGSGGKHFSHSTARDSFSDTHRRSMNGGPLRSGKLWGHSTQREREKKGSEHQHQCTIARQNGESAPPQLKF